MPARFSIYIYTRPRVLALIYTDGPYLVAASPARVCVLWRSGGAAISPFLFSLESFAYADQGGFDAMLLRRLYILKLLSVG